MQTGFISNQWLPKKEPAAICHSCGVADSHPRFQRGPLLCVSRQERQQMQEVGLCTSMLGRTAYRKHLPEEGQRKCSKWGKDPLGPQFPLLFCLAVWGISEGKLIWRLMGGCRVREKEFWKTLQSSWLPEIKVIIATLTLWTSMCKCDLSMFSVSSLFPVS